jgi:steroid delta-isomerase-like uncharacterized protein
MVSVFGVAMACAALAQSNGKGAGDPSSKSDDRAIRIAPSGGTSMDQSSLSENKTLIRKLFEDEINHKDLDVFAGMVSSDYISHNDSIGPPADVKQTKSFLAAVFAAFPDTQVTIEDMVAEGDKVVVRNTWRGTFRGPWMGIAPTGKEVTWTGIVIWRIKNGKIKERWANINFPEVMQRIASAQSPEKK